jgi:hypothetical protein
VAVGPEIVEEGAANVVGRGHGGDLVGSGPPHKRGIWSPKRSLLRQGNNYRKISHSMSDASWPAYHKYANCPRHLSDFGTEQIATYKMGTGMTPLKGLIASVAFLTTSTTLAQQESDENWRKAAWAMKALPANAHTTEEVDFGKGVFLQPVLAAEAIHLNTTSAAELFIMPMAKKSVPVSFSASTPYFRVLTSETHRKMYCSPDSEYRASSGMFKIQARICVSDDNNDGILDHGMNATITRPVNDQAPLPVYLLGLDNPSYQPITIHEDSRNKISIPYIVEESDTQQFYIGPAIMRDGNRFSVGLILADQKGSGTMTTEFDPEVHGTISNQPLTSLAKRPQFKHMREIDLSKLPATIEIEGAKFVVHSVTASSVKVEIIKEFPTDKFTAVAYSGLLAK